MRAGDPIFGEPSLRVAKVGVPVTVLLAGGTVLEGEVHVFPGVGEGRERVIDLLNAPEPFLPLTSKSGASLLGKSQVVTVTVGERFDARLGGAAAPTAPEVDVEINLAAVPDRRALVRGQLRLDMPPDQLRLLDYLNGARAFFPMAVPEGAVIVSRSFVVGVRAAPRRAAPSLPAARAPGRRRAAAARRRSRR